MQINWNLAHKRVSYKYIHSQCNAKLSIGKIYEINMHQVHTIYFHHKLTQNVTNHRQKKAKNIDFWRNKYTQSFHCNLATKFTEHLSKKMLFVNTG